MSAVREAGVPHYRRHQVGHGIGVEIHDPVVAGPGNDDRLEKGTVVVAFEVRIEDPFVVDAVGNRLPATPERRLTVIG